MTAKFGSGRTWRLSKEIFWVIFGQALALLGTLVGMRALTGLLAPSAYGELALGMSAVGVIYSIVFWPLSSGAARFYAPAQEAGDVACYLYAVRRFALWASGVVVLSIPFIAVGLFVSAHAQWLLFAVVTVIFAVLNGGNDIFNGIQDAARHRHIVAVHKAMESWLKFLAAVALILLFRPTSVFVLAGYSVAAIAVLVSQLIFFRRAISSKGAAVKGGRDWTRDIWNYSWPFVSWGLFSSVHAASDRWALGAFATTKDVGMFAVLFQLGYYPMAIFTGMAMQFLTPIFYKRTGDASDGSRMASVAHLTWRLTGLTLGATAIVFVAALFFHKQFYRLLAAGEYASVSYLLPWMILASGIWAAGEILALHLKSTMKTKKIAKAQIILAFFGVGSNFLGTSLYGMTGIVGVAVLFSSIYFVMMALLSIASPEPMSRS